MLIESALTIQPCCCEFRPGPPMGMGSSNSKKFAGANGRDRRGEFLAGDGIASRREGASGRRYPIRPSRRKAGDLRSSRRGRREGVGVAMVGTIPIGTIYRVVAN